MSNGLGRDSTPNHWDPGSTGKGFAPMSASDKLFYWLFQLHPDRILELQRDLPAEACGWRFSAPVVKERERRLDGWFQPPPDRPELPVVLLEAQMKADPRFLRRLRDGAAVKVQIQLQWVEEAESPAGAARTRTGRWGCRR